MNLGRTVLLAAGPWIGLLVLFLINRALAGSIPEGVTFAVDIVVTIVAASYFLYLLGRKKLHIGWDKKELDAVDRELSGHRGDGV